jgi:AcrR family transcriptional regulator
LLPTNFHLTALSNVTILSKQTMESVLEIMVLEENSSRPKRKQSRQQRRYGRTRAKLIEAARSVFAERGLDLTTVDDITSRADVGRGTFYYHFSSKADLIGELVDSLLGELVAEIRARCEGHDNLAELLDALVIAHVDFFSKRWEDFVLYYAGRADLTLVESYEVLETPFLDYMNSIESLVDSAMSEPISKPVLRRLACAIAGFISGYYSFAVIASEGEDVDRTFLSLRSAFVGSLVRFVSDTVPDTGKGGVGPRL